MKRLFLVMLFPLLLITINAQKIPTNELEFYTIDELKRHIEQQNISSSNSYWCQAPIELLCQIFPRFRIYDYREPQNLETLIPFQSVADLEKIKEELEPIIRQTMPLILLYNVPSESNLRNTIQNKIKEHLNYQLEQYSNGILLPSHDWPFLVWSTLKYQDDPREITLLGIEPNYYTTQQEAETKLGSSVTLVRTMNSIYNYTNTVVYSDPLEPVLDEFIWVSGTEATGFNTKKHYQIVDESGQPLNLLEDDIETRFTTTTIDAIDLLSFQIMFDLVEIDE